jgi:hypothetical protein
MDFILAPHDKLLHMDKTNQDYDIEVLWYGLRNLVNNYFKHLYVGKSSIIEYIENISNNLNSFQSNKQYLEIYIEIYKFLIEFLKSYLHHFETTYLKYLETKKHSSFNYNYNLIETWLNRYNKIDYVKKIKVPYDYVNTQTINNIDENTKIYIRFIISGIVLKDEYDLCLLTYFSSDFNKFMDYVIENNIGKLFDIISCKFNLQDYYNYKKINQKYIPIKFNKFSRSFLNYYKKTAN